MIYFPMGISSKISARDVAIYAEFNGSNHAELARKYKISLVWIYKIIKAMRKGVTQPKGLTLTGWLVSKGGLQDFQGEVAALGVDTINGATFYTINANERAVITFRDGIAWFAAKSAY